MREALRDRSYRSTPLGLETARYYRWKKNEWGAAAETLRDYEAILAKLALFHSDLELRNFAPPVGSERLRECWDHYWGDRSARTRAKVRSVWIDFFEWAVRERGLSGNPARPLAAPKKRDVPTEVFPPSLVERIIGAQTYAADVVGAALVLHYGLRRGGIVNARRRDFDFPRPGAERKARPSLVVPLPRTRGPRRRGYDRRDEHAPGEAHGGDGTPARAPRSPADAAPTRARGYSLDGPVRAARHGRLARALLELQERRD
jgi:integrase